MIRPFDISFLMMLGFVVVMGYFVYFFVIKK